VAPVIEELRISLRDSEHYLEEWRDRIRGARSQQQQGAVPGEGGSEAAEEEGGAKAGQRGGEVDEGKGCKPGAEDDDQIATVGGLCGSEIMLRHILDTFPACQLVQPCSACSQALLKAASSTACDALLLGCNCRPGCVMYWVRSPP
jgi:hypothetical protein